MSESKKTNIKTSELIVFIVMAILIICGFTITLIGLFDGSLDPIIQIPTLVMYIFVVFYCVYGYKIPHGDLMKYVFLGFAFVTGYLAATSTPVVGSSEQKVAEVASIIMLICASVVTAFVSGRLNRIEENEPLSIIILILLVGAGAIMTFLIPALSVAKFEGLGIANYVAPFNLAILWGSIYLTYSARFALHKKAGKNQDKVEK